MPTVVRKLRNKIWAILVASFYTLILCILFISYLSSGRRVQEDTHQALYFALISNELYFSDSFLSIKVDNETGAYTVHSAFGLSDEEYDELLRLVLENARDYNEIALASGRSWAYAYAPERELVPYAGGLTYYPDALGGTTERIVLVNTSNFVARHDELRVRLIFVGGFGLFAIVLGAYWAAQYFVKSTRKSFETQAVITSKQKKFTANATHELKTPVAMIKGSYDEILRNKDQTIESQMKWFDMIEFGTKRMENLISELLVLARLEDREIEFPKTAVNISATVHRTVEIMQVLATEKGIQIEENIEPNLITQLNEEKFMQIGMIFLENAIKYVDKQGRIEINAYQKDGQVVVSVQNTGPGIPAKSLPKLFDRFYRVDERSKAGSGLGLPIAKEIVEQLGGELTVDSIENEVTTVLVKFQVQ